MSFLVSAEKIYEGATAIVYVNHRLQYYITVKRGETFQTKFGALRHDYVIDKPYGCKVQLQKGFVHVLRPTPESWTANLDHRTQILYPPDINLICLQLDLSPGSVVVETGTGSGGLSHGIARCIAPAGHLHTFDVVQDRIDIVQREFDCHGYSNVATARMRNVCDDGFPTELVGKADAVFLDLPTPWAAIDAAAKLLRKDVSCRICTFSPCVEQVTRNVEKLTALGFVSIETVTTGALQLKVNEIMLPSAAEFFASKEKRRKPPTEAFPGKEPAAKILKCDGGDMAADGDTNCESQCLNGAFPEKQKFVNPQIYPLCQNVHSGYLTFATLLPAC